MEKKNQNNNDIAILMKKDFDNFYYVNLEYNSMNKERAGLEKRSKLSTSSFIKWIRTRF